jgi:hypothetical protein
MEHRWQQVVYTFSYVGGNSSLWQKAYQHAAGSCRKVEGGGGGGGGEIPPSAGMLGSRSRGPQK